MERELETNLVWEHIDKRLGMFLIATRFKSCKDEWKIFKLMCNSQVKYKEGIFEHLTFKKLVERQKKIFLFESGEWNFDAIFQYLDSLEKEGILYIGTPFELVDEIVNKTPEDHLIERYLADELRILDPACGRGRFLLSMKRRLLELMTEEEAIKCLYGIDIDPRSALLTAALIDPKGLCEKSQIYCADTLNDFPKELKDMKFDVIVGNPPFQDATAKSSKKSWKEFFKKSFEISSSTGIIALISPASWMKPNNDLFEFFRGKNYCKFINLNVKEFFPGIGSTFTYYIIHKNHRSGDTTIKNGDIEFDIDMNQIGFIPLDADPLKYSILDKLFKHKPIGVEFDSYFHTQYKELSENKTKEFKYPIKHTATKTLWAKEKHPSCEHKRVLFPLSSAMKAEADVVGEYGVTQHYAYIICDKSPEAIVAYLHSKLISFLRIITNWDGSWDRNIVKMIPSLPTEKPMTDQEIYEYFNLTKEEIELIESTVK